MFKIFFTNEGTEVLYNQNLFSQYDALLLQNYSIGKKLDWPPFKKHEGHTLINGNAWWKSCMVPEKWIVPLKRWKVMKDPIAPEHCSWSVETKQRWAIWIADVFLCDHHQVSIRVETRLLSSLKCSWIIFSSLYPCECRLLLLASRCQIIWFACMGPPWKSLKDLLMATWRPMTGHVMVRWKSVNDNYQATHFLTILFCSALLAPYRMHNILNMPSEQGNCCFFCIGQAIQGTVFQ